jgi:hypothetical protein
MSAALKVKKKVGAAFFFQSGPAIPAAAYTNTDSYLVLWTHSVATYSPFGLHSWK